MNQRKHLTLIAAGSAFLSALPLINVFESQTWAIRSFLVVAAMCGVGLLVRSLRAPAWAPTASMALAGLVALTWLFRSGQEYIGIIPSPGTIMHFGELLSTATTEMSEFATPVGDREGFLFLATLGVAVVALLVDLFSVVLRRPALAGLPMLAIYSVPVTVTTESTSWFPFVLGAVGFLWLLVTDNVDRVRRFGRRFTGDGRDVDLWEPSPLAAAGQRLGAVGVLAAVLLPLIPFAMPAGVLDRFGAGAGGGPGIGGRGGNGRSVSMFALLDGQLNRNKKTDMVKVTNVNDKNPFYLRFAALEELTNRGFSAKPIAGGQPVNSGLPGPEWDASIGRATYKANIEVTNELAIYFLPVYTWPTKIDKVDNEWAFDKRTASVYSSKNKQTSAKRKYTVEYVRPEITNDDLRNAKPVNLNDPALRDVLTAPNNPVVKSTVEKLIQGKETQIDKVLAIYNFFSPANNFVYDTSTGPDTSGTKIADFLQNKRGYCAQYAAAFGWLLREAKIPSRVAFGFARGDVQNGTMTLTNINLHAWTEVYFPGFGWLPFDATPASAISGSVTPSYLPRADDTITGDDPVDRGGADVGADPSSSAAAPGTDPGDNPGTTGGDTSATETSTLDTALAAGPWVLGGGLLLLLLLSPALTRTRTRRRRLTLAGPATARAPATHTPPGTAADAPAMTVLPPDDKTYVAARTDAHSAWDELVDLMIDYHVPTDDAETPRATVDRLVAKERLRDKAESGARLLSTAEEHARYARRPLTGRELRGAVSDVQTAFAARAPRKTRILAVLLPPSVLRRWRSAASARSSTISVTLGRGWDQLMRALSVRRLVTKRADR